MCYDAVVYMQTTLEATLLYTDNTMHVFYIVLHLTTIDVH